MERAETAQNELIRSVLTLLSDTPPLLVTRKLVGNRDQGCTLVARSLLGGLTGELKRQLIHWGLHESTGRAPYAMGALAGLVIGDWVGAPLEFLEAVSEPSESRWDHDCFAHENPKTDLRLRGLLKQGQWTDDTSMALCLADSLIVHKGFDGADLRVRFWNWHAEGYNNTFRFDPIGSTNTKKRAPRASFGLGFNIAKSLMSLEPNQIVSPAYCNPGSEDSGNGGLMRLAPVPIFFATRGIHEAMDVAAQSSLTTHPGALATEAARCLAFITHRAINLSSTMRAAGANAFLRSTCGEYADLLEDRIQSGDDKLHSTGQLKYLEEVQALLLSSKPEDNTESCWNWQSPTLDILGTLQKRGKEYNGHPVSRGYFGSYCMDGLALALHAVAHTQTFHHAIERAVNFLGDADTVGAIAGQIAGAFYGYPAIDSRYVDPIREWDHDEIVCRAVICFMLGADIDVDRMELSSCCCCEGCGVVPPLGVCPLCDGNGYL